MNRNRVILLIVIVLAGLAVYQSVTKETDEAATIEDIMQAELQEAVAPLLNHAAPSFKLTGLDGKTYKVGGKRDKPLMLNFWASWCAPCEQEAPDLARLYEKYGGQFDLYAVNITRNDLLDEVKQFVERFDFTFPVLLDEKLAVAELYRTRVIPTSFLIDKNGVIVDVFNVLSAEELEERLKRVIQSE